MYKLVLFDLDGTVADTDSMLVATFIELYRIYRPGYQPSINYMLTFSGPPIKETLTREFPNLDFAFSLAEFRRLSLPNYDLYVKAFPGVRELVNELHRRGIKAGVVTSKHRGPSEYTLKLINLEGVFDLLIASDDVNVPKPNPEGINKALVHFGILSKSEVLYVGDTVTDYLTAKNAGVNFALVAWTPRELPRSAKANYYLDSYAHFFEVINDEKTS